MDVCVPGQDRPLITLKIVRTHMGMQMAPVVVVVATTFVGGIVTVADVSHSNGRSFDTRETSHTGELLS